MPPSFKVLQPGDISLLERPMEDEQVPEGTFFAASEHVVESMAVNDVAEYSAFFASIVNASPYYSLEEKKITIEMRSVDKVEAKLNDNKWILLTVKDSESGKMIGSLEAQLIANRGKEVFGAIKWTLVHPDFRRQGIGIQMKLEFENILRQQGYAGIITGIRDNNVASIEMNRAQGILRDDSIPMSMPQAAWYTKRFKPDTP